MNRVLCAPRDRKNRCLATAFATRFQMRDRLSSYTHLMYNSLEKSFELRDERYVFCFFTVQNNGVFFLGGSSVSKPKHAQHEERELSCYCRLEETTFPIATFLMLLVQHDHSFLRVRTSSLLYAVFCGRTKRFLSLFGCYASAPSSFLFNTQCLFCSFPG